MKKDKNLNNTEKIPKSANNISIIILVAIIISSGGLSLLQAVNGYSYYQQALSSESWPATIGIVISSGVIQKETLDPEAFSTDRYYIPVINYTYSVDNHNYSSNRVSFYLELVEGFREEAMAQEIIDKYPVGQNVSVHYNPKNPNIAILEPGSNEIVHNHWKMSSLIILGSGLIMSWLARVIFLRRWCSIKIIHFTTFLFGLFVISSITLLIL